MRIRDKGELQKACDLIGQCGYWRQKQELEDAEEAAKDWYRWQAVVATVRMLSSPG